MTTVYAVSHGEYSDYSVDRIFEAREDAERYAKARGASERYLAYRVEEMEFHPRGTALNLWTNHHVFIALARVGTRLPGDMWDWSEVEVGAPKFAAARSDYSDVATSSGPDLERCRKSCRDFYARWVAEREGIS